MIYLEKFEDYINDEEIYQDFKNFILNGENRNSEIWGTYDRRWFEFRNIAIYVRKNKRVLENETCDVLDIGDIETKDFEQFNRLFEDMLTWLMKEFPNVNIFIENQNIYTPFKLFGEYITENGNPNSNNILLSLGFKEYPKCTEMFYLKR